jgi:hypothetical protein
MESINLRYLPGSKPVMIYDIRRVKQLQKNYELFLKFIRLQSKVWADIFSFSLKNSKTCVFFISKLY